MWQWVFLFPAAGLLGKLAAAWLYVLSQQLLDAGRHVRCTLADSDLHAVNEAKWKLPRG